MKGKILYIGGFNLPDNNAAAQRVIANSKLFRHLGYEIFLVGLNRSIEKTERFEYEGFHCENLVYPVRRGDWIKYLFSFSHYKIYIENYSPDIIIAYNHPAVALNRLRSYCLKKNIQLISDCTEWYEPQGGLLFRLIKGFDVNFRMKYIHPRLDAIIVISNYLYNYYVTRQDALLLLPPLVDKQDLKWDLAKKHSVESDTIKFIFAGSIGNGNKDRLDWIVLSIIKLRSHLNVPIELIIIGITETDFHTIYPDVTSEIPSFIHFKGRLSHNEVLSHLHGADAQIILREDNLANRAGFPTKFVESISSNIPVITNLTTGLDGYFQHQVNGIHVDATNMDSLYESLKSIKCQKELFHTLKKNINANQFDYRNFIDEASVFMNQKL